MDPFVYILQISSYFYILFSSLKESIEHESLGAVYFEHSPHIDNKIKRAKHVDYLCLWGEELSSCTR